MNFDYDGSAMRVKVGGNTILHEIEFNFEATTEFKELASKDVQNAVSAGKKTYTLTGNGYADNSSDGTKDIKYLFDWQDDQSKANVLITDEVAGNLTITSTDAYLETIGITSTNDETVTYSFTMRLTNATYGDIGEDFIATAATIVIPDGNATDAITYSATYTDADSSTKFLPVTSISPAIYTDGTSDYNVTFVVPAGYANSGTSIIKIIGGVTVS